MTADAVSVPGVSFDVSAPFDSVDVDNTVEKSTRLLPRGIPHSPLLLSGVGYN